MRSASKRSACTLSMSPVDPLAPSSLCHDPSQQQQGAKRMCSGPAGYAIPSMQQQQPHPHHPHAPRLSGVHEILQRLTRAHVPAAMHAHPGLHDVKFPDDVWQCLGELNQLMEQSFASVPAHAIRGYHSFTRMPKELLAERYLSGLQQQLQQATAGKHAAPLWAAATPALPLQAQMVLFLLSRVLSSYPDAALVQYTLEVPPWLLPWCLRWGLGQRQEGTEQLLVSFLAVHVYCPGTAGGWGAGGSGPVVYVPAYQQ